VATGLTVLHVEDDVALADSVRLLLKSAGHGSVQAYSSAEALGKVTNDGIQPDVLIVDYNLNEEMTGTDVAEQIARITGYPVPTIVLSADLPNAEVPWLPGAPIMLVSKPVDPNSLLETVEHFSELHRLSLSRRGKYA
jgi:CheY-like chemotaxis protein